MSEPLYAQMAQSVIDGEDEIAADGHAEDAIEAVDVAKTLMGVA